MRSFASRVVEFFEPPDPTLVEAGAGGERFVARTRLVFWTFISLAPMSAVLAGGRSTPREVWIALGAVVFAMAISVGVLLFLRGGKRIPWVGFVTGAADTTIVTMTLVVIALAGRPTVALDSAAVWAVYLLAILATSVRFDVRVCLFVGALTIAEFSTLILWITSRWDIPINIYSPDVPESTSLLVQVARLMLMLAATALSVGIVHRSRRLVNASGTDRLTGLGNRAYFEGRFAAEIARVTRSGDPLTLVFFDLDHFKRFNDRWGHETGDEVLKAVARITRFESRAEDVIARWGGEEIAMILPDTDMAGAILKVTRIRRRLASEPLVGVDAKRGGRDRVVCDDLTPLEARTS